MTKNDGGPAFPVTPEFRGTQDGRFENATFSGMSLRDWFAGMALAGLMAYPEDNQEAPEDWARRCYAFADAMLKERAREE